MRRRRFLEATSTLIAAGAVGPSLVLLLGRCGGGDGFELTSVITVFGELTLDAPVEGVVIFVNRGRRDVVGVLRVSLLTGDGRLVDQREQNLVVPGGPQPYVAAFDGLFGREPGEHKVRGEAFGFRFLSEPFVLTE